MKIIRYDNTLPQNAKLGGMMRQATELCMRVSANGGRPSALEHDKWSRKGRIARDAMTSAIESGLSEAIGAIERPSLDDQLQACLIPARDLASVLTACAIAYGAGDGFDVVSSNGATQHVKTLDFLNALADFGLPNVLVPLARLVSVNVKDDPKEDDDELVAALCCYYCSVDPRFDAVYAPCHYAEVVSPRWAGAGRLSSFLCQRVDGSSNEVANLTFMWMSLFIDDGTSPLARYVGSNGTKMPQTPYMMRVSDSTNMEVIQGLSDATGTGLGISLDITMSPVMDMPGYVPVPMELSITQEVADHIMRSDSVMSHRPMTTAEFASSMYELTMRLSMDGGIFSKETAIDAMSAFSTYCITWDLRLSDASCDGMTAMPVVLTTDLQSAAIEIMQETYDESDDDAGDDLISVSFLAALCHASSDVSSFVRRVTGKRTTDSALSAVRASVEGAPDDMDANAFGHISYEPGGILMGLATVAAFRRGAATVSAMDAFDALMSIDNSASYAIRSLMPAASMSRGEWDGLAPSGSKWLANACKSVQGDALAVVAKTSPHRVTAQSPFVSSIILDVAQTLGLHVEERPLLTDAIQVFADEIADRADGIDASDSCLLGDSRSFAQLLTGRIADALHRLMSISDDPELSECPDLPDIMSEIIVLTALASKRTLGRDLASVMMPWGAVTSLSYVPYPVYEPVDEDDGDEGGGGSDGPESWKPAPENDAPYLRKIGNDLTALAARNVEQVPIVDRDEVVDEMITVLCRQDKSNPALIAPAGTGKTAIVERLCQRIVAGDVPEKLRNRRVISVHPTFRGGDFKSLEDAVSTAVQEAAETNAILFIDEIHMITDVGGREMNVANLLKPELARHGVSLIGATTDVEYQRTIGRDKALDRRFAPIRVTEMTMSQVLDVLASRRPIYERSYGLRFADNSNRLIARLAREHLSMRHSPDRELELMDTSAAAAYVSGDEKVTVDDIYKSIRMLAHDDSIKPLSAADATTDAFKHIAGQEEAKEKIGKRLSMSMLGMFRSNAPRNIFLFTGPSGVGKTMMANAIGSYLGLQTTDILTLQMSEYAHPADVTRLIGSSPGYIGYGEGGTLTNFIKAHPSGVVIFDEIDKAVPEVRTYLLGPFDNGFIDSAMGDHIDCRATTFICTMNGNETGTESSIGFGKKEHNERIDKRELVNMLGAPFVERMDEVIRFTHLTKDDYRDLVRDRIQVVRDEYAAAYAIDVSAFAEEMLSERSVEDIVGRFDTEYGARGICRYIDDRFREHVAEMSDLRGGNEE